MVSPFVIFDINGVIFADDFSCDIVSDGINGITVRPQSIEFAFDFLRSSDTYPAMSLFVKLQRFDVLIPLQLCSAICGCFIFPFGKGDGDSQMNRY